MAKKEGEDEKETRDTNALTPTIIEATVGAGLGGATTGTLAGAALGAAAPLATRVVGAVWTRAKQFHQERWGRRSETFEGEMERRYASEPEEVRKRIEARVGDPEAMPPFIAAARALNDAVDDAVVPAIAALTLEYTSRGAKPDYFFRGLLNILVTLDSAELDTLRQWMRSFVGYVDNHGLDAKALTIAATEEGPKFVRPSDLRDFSAHYVAGEPAPHPVEAPPAVTDLPGAPHARRLVHLLYVHELALEARTEGAFFDSARTVRGMNISMEVEMARRLDKLLNGAP